MDPVFTKLLIRTAIVGGTIGIVAFAVLFFTIRAYRKGTFGASVLLVALLVFVFVSCLVLLVASLR